MVREVVHVCSDIVERYIHWMSINTIRVISDLLFTLFMKDYFLLSLDFPFFLYFWTFSSRIATL